MNPHSIPDTTFLAMINSIWRNRNLCYQLTKREVASRYSGSVFGVAWSFIIPISMLAVYTFVFTFVFNARWGVHAGENKVDFAIILFIGLLIHTFFAEVLIRSPALLLDNTNYVKKVVFPLETLPIVVLGSALFQMVVSVLILLFVIFFFSGLPNWTSIFLPLTILPVIPITLGFAWILSSLGVYIRDLNQFIGVIMTLLLFLGPILYPVSALPIALQPLIYVNPLTYPIEQTRGVLLFGEIPNWFGLVIYCIVSISISYCGFWWFQKTRKGFADVI